MKRGASVVWQGETRGRIGESSPAARVVVDVKVERESETFGPLATFRVERRVRDALDEWAWVRLDDDHEAQIAALEAALLATLEKVTP